MPPSLIESVEFWSKIYRKWDSNQIVFYDQKTKEVYHVLDLPKLNGVISSYGYQKTIQDKFEQIKNFLELTDKNKAIAKNKLQQNILKISKTNVLTKRNDLAANLKYQNGLKSQFEYALKISGKYETEMRSILKAYGLPHELLALVFVESLFYINANSYANAAGPWGILKETALQHGIHVNNFTDERIDPVISTLAAAQFLKRAHKGLGKWPLAITAYNYGYPGMMRARKNLNTTDIGVIIEHHDSPIFGYACKNYYAEFLAALDTITNQKKYFPNLTKEKPWQYDLVQVLRPLNVSDLLNHNVITTDTLKALNPSLTANTLTGSEVIPPNYSFRIPKGLENIFYEKLKKISHQDRSQAGFKISTKHMTNGEESLSSIAKTHGISLDFLCQKMDKDSRYKPKGAVIIRSQSYLFSSLLELNKKLNKPTPVH